MVTACLLFMCSWYSTLDISQKDIMVFRYTIYNTYGSFVLYTVCHIIYVFTMYCLMCNI